MKRNLQELQLELREVWSRSDAIFDLLHDDAWSHQPIPLRHPFCFYLGHLPAFAYNQIGVGVLGRPAHNASFDQLFEFGIDPLQTHESITEQWPDLGEIAQYRDEIRKLMPELVDELSERSDELDPLIRSGRILHLVIEHELMHHETLLYMIAALPHDLKRCPVDYRRQVTQQTPDRATTYVPAGCVTLGADLGAADFLWDNETPARTVKVDGFVIDRFPVSNLDYASFVDAGGYQQRRYWDDEGWQWICSNNMTQPWSWRGKGEQRTVRGLFEDVPFAEARGWPASVSHVEASAFGRFSGGRLPAEAEIRRAALTDETGMRAFPWGSDTPCAARTTVGGWSARPIGSTPAGSSGWDVEELYGNGWEWTSSVWADFPGFRRTIRTYPGYSADFFDGHHRAMFGASWATPKRLLRPTFRNWFQRRYPYVFSKFRLVKTA